MTFAAAYEDVPGPWGVGRVVVGDTITPWPVSQSDIDDEAESMRPRLAALGLGEGGLVLIVSLLPALCFAQAPKAKGVKSAPAMTEAAVKHEDRIYKKTPQGELSLHFSFPVDWKAADTGALLPAPTL